MYICKKIIFYLAPPFNTNSISKRIRLKLGQSTTGLDFYRRCLCRWYLTGISLLVFFYNWPKANMFAHFFQGSGAIFQLIKTSGECQKAKKGPVGIYGYRFRLLREMQNPVQTSVK